MVKLQKTVHLNIIRTLADGRKIKVGELAENRQGIFFAYDEHYRQYFPHLSLSPFKLRFEQGLQLAPKEPHNGLHGVFADSLPDGWGMLLQDRFFASNGVDFYRISPLDRLAFVGEKGIGAMSFEPKTENSTEDVSLTELGKNAEQLFDGQTEEVLNALIQAGSSGGARPKAQIFMPPQQTNTCRTVAQQGDEAWIVKFTSKNLPLQFEEGLCEAAYLSMAETAQLQPVEWQLLNQQSQPWLAVKRFDYLAETAGRVHTHSLCGLLDASYRMPSMDYFGLLKATKLLCHSRQASQLQFRRAIFNLFALNQDDHTKNWAFVQDEQGNWYPSPAYDMTFSPLRHGEHSMAFGLYGSKPPLKVIQELADVAGFNNWLEAKAVIGEIVGAINTFNNVAKQLDITKTTISQIQKSLDRVWQENRGLLK